MYTSNPKKFQGFWWKNLNISLHEPVNDLSFISYLIHAEKDTLLSHLIRLSQKKKRRCYKITDPMLTENNRIVSDFGFRIVLCDLRSCVCSFFVGQCESLSNPPHNPTFHLLFLSFFLSFFGSENPT